MAIPSLAALALAALTLQLPQQNMSISGSVVCMFDWGRRFDCISLSREDSQRKLGQIAFIFPLLFVDLMELIDIHIGSVFVCVCVFRHAKVLFVDYLQAKLQMKEMIIVNISLGLLRPWKIYIVLPGTRCSTYGVLQWSNP